MIWLALFFCYAAVIWCTIAYGDTVPAVEGSSICVHRPFNDDPFAQNMDALALHKCNRVQLVDGFKQLATYHKITLSTNPLVYYQAPRDMDVFYVTSPDLSVNELYAWGRAVTI
jgi:hypothetical protein